MSEPPNLSAADVQAAHDAAANGLHDWQESDFAMVVTYPRADGPVERLALNEMALDACSVCGVLRVRPGAR